MSIEQALAANTAAIQALTAAFSAHQTPVVPAQAPVAPPAAPPAPPPAAAMPAAPFQPPAAAQPAGLPFNDNVSAAAWATAAWQAVAAVNQDQAMQEFGALMQAMGCQDFNQLTPDKFPMLHQGIQGIKTKMGVAG